MNDPLDNEAELCSVHSAAYSVTLTFLGTNGEKISVTMPPIMADALHVELGGGPETARTTVNEAGMKLASLRVYPRGQATTPTRPSGTLTQPQGSACPYAVAERMKARLSSYRDGQMGSRLGNVG